MEAGQDGQAEEPEPEEEINLLVDNVEGEDAETVELLLAGRSAHGVEGAAVPGVKDGVGGGVPGDGGEDRTHGVGQVAPCGLVMAEVLDHLGAVPGDTSHRGKLIRVTS